MRLPPLLVTADGLSPGSRVKLVTSLYAPLRSAIEGGVALMACHVICWYETGWPGFAGLLFAAIAVSGWRLHQRARFLSRENAAPGLARSPEIWAGRFVTGITVTSVLWSATVIITYSVAHDVALEMLVLAILGGWMGAGCVRNAASPASIAVPSAIILPSVIAAIGFFHSTLLDFVGLLAFLQLSGNLSVSRHIGRQLSSLLASEERLETANLRLQLLSATDGLTGIGNRRAFDTTLQTEWPRALREQTPLGLLLVDVDFFKRYNDSRGHMAGDECLRIVALILEDGLRRPPDFAGRFGGEEFVCLLPGTTEAGAIDVARRLQLAIAQAALPHDATPSGLLTVSIGAASLVPQSGEAPQLLIELADKALYAAKAAGRDTVCAGRRRFETASTHR